LVSSGSEISESDLEEEGEDIEIKLKNLEELEKNINLIVNKFLSKYKKKKTSPIKS